MSFWNSWFGRTQERPSPDEAPERAKPFTGDIREAVNDAVRDFLASPRFAEIERDVTIDCLQKGRGRPLSRQGFAWGMALHFYRCGMAWAEAVRLGESTLAEYLSEEAMEYGDPRYAWDLDGAFDIAREMETDHWEAA